MNPDPMGDNAFAVHTCDLCTRELDREAIECFYEGQICIHCQPELPCETCYILDCKLNTNLKLHTE